MLSEKLTVERIERQHKHGRIFIGACRALAVAFAALVLVAAVVSGEWYLLIYLALPPLWWVLCAQWKRSVDDSRRIQYRTLERWRRLGK